jgi:hypothetical protein
MNRNLVGSINGKSSYNDCSFCLNLLTNMAATNSHRGPSIDASYQVSVYLAKLCQTRRFLETYQSEKRIVCGSHVC